MATEPENTKMEELLKSYADKRRKEAGPMELHPATRRMLQSEAASLRGNAKVSAQGWWQVLLQFWPRMAVTAGIVLVLGGTLYMANKDRPSREMAKADWKRGLVAGQTNAQDQSSNLAMDKAKAAEEYVTRAARKPQSDTKDFALAEKPADLRRSAEPLPSKPSGPARFDDQSRAPLEKFSESLDRKDQVQLKQEVAINGAASTSEAKTKRDGSDALGLRVNKSQAELRPDAAAQFELEGQKLAKQTEGVDAPEATGRARFAIPRTESVIATTPPPLPTAPAAPVLTAPAVAFSTEALSASADAASGTLAIQYGNAYYFKNLDEVTTSPATPAPARTRDVTKKDGDVSKSVLSSFQVIQEGSAIRVVDADGSIYTGEVVAATDALDRYKAGLEAESNRESTQPAARPAEPAPPPVTAQPSRSQWSTLSATSTNTINQQAETYFRVSGTNRTLQQSVVVTARFANDSTMDERKNYGRRLTQSQTGGAFGGGGGRAGGGRGAPANAPLITDAPTREDGKLAAKSLVQPPATNQITRVIGEARIGTTNQMRFNALRVK